ncbi:MAG: hypothetical protein ACLFVT_04700 [Syntrophobacteria bacterium]
MRTVTKAKVIKDLEEALWSMIVLEEYTGVSDKEVMRRTIRSFLDERIEPLSIEELIDIFFAPGEIMTLFLEYVRTRGVAGGPIALH